MTVDDRPIGVFDSGLGGLTVVRQLMRQLPCEDIIYFGDTGRVPYGTRSPETIEKYAAQDCRFLIGKGVKFIIAACGTVSSVAAHVLSCLPVPAVGVVEPAALAAVKASGSKRIGVAGTSATINSGSFKAAIEKLEPGAKVFQRACPLFVPLVENGWIDTDDEITRLTAERYLQPMKEEGIDTLLLGCTHYPLLAPVIGGILGPNVALIDSGQATASYCAEYLKSRDMLAPGGKKGELKFYVSDRPGDFSKVASMFLGQEIDDSVCKVDIEQITGSIC